MHNSNECKRNFVAIYDGSSSVEHLKNKFCSTVANDVMLVNSVGVVRMWADEGSRKSRFKILFTTFHSRESRHPWLWTDVYLMTQWLGRDGKMMNDQSRIRKTVPRQVQTPSDTPIGFRLLIEASLFVLCSHHIRTYTSY
jgi:hypothetical protein